ncbi:MAG: PilW family protein [Gammaproteobacteria bacterium]|nr:PilW family protein [Gammaproteobacteria bacterium]
MNFRYSNPAHASGFSLIEMLVAMLIGLVIMSGVMQLYKSTRDTQRNTDDQLAMLGDARFAIEAIAYDLRHAGIWGRHNNTDQIYCRKRDNVCPASVKPPAAVADCAPQQYIDLNLPLYAADDMNPYSTTCILGTYKAGTDVLELRYADTNPMGANVLAADTVYIRANYTNGLVFLGPNIPTENETGLKLAKWSDNTANSIHSLVSRTYYVGEYADTPGDGMPSLYRGDVVAGPEMKNEVLLRGVEDFQLEFGIDNLVGYDGHVHRYVSAADIADNQWDAVRTVRIWLLMRSERADMDNIGAAQTFDYAGKIVTKANDGYRRYLVTSVVKVRNNFNTDQVFAGAK